MLDLLAPIRTAAATAITPVSEPPLVSAGLDPLASADGVAATAVEDAEAVAEASAVGDAVALAACLATVNWSSEK
jgi:hypothetical protein